MLSPKLYIWKNTIDNMSDNKEKLKALQLTIDKLDKTYGKGTVMRMSEQKIDAIEADNRRMMQDLHQARQTKNMLDERIQVVMKRASAAADANKILSAQLHSIQVERDAMRALVGVERNRANDQTAVAAAARASAATFQSNNSPGIKVPKPVTLKKDDDDEN